jgi:hypothetical protein
MLLLRDLYVHAEPVENTVGVKRPLVKQAELCVSTLSQKHTRHHGRQACSFVAVGLSETVRR